MARDEFRMPDPWFTGQEGIFTIDHGRMMRQKEFGGWIIPPFQRGLVWTPEQKVRLVESLWYELPIGIYVYNAYIGRLCPFNHWLLDGQQRWDAIFSYLDDEFPVFGLRWSELNDVEQRVFGMKRFPAMVTQYTDEATLRNIFERLAYGGTPNAPELLEVVE